MKFTDWLRGFRHSRMHRPTFRELCDIEEKARHLAARYDHGELAKLIARYRDSDDTVGRIAVILAGSSPFTAPGAAVERCAIEMMEALKETPYMEKCGTRLSQMAPDDASMIHGLFAMYTFMQDSALDKFPVKGLERPPHEEVIAAIRILDRQRYGQNVSELCELSAYSMLPSKYVRMRYGLERHCDAYCSVRDHLTPSDNPRILLQAEADMCRAAEEAVEYIDGVRLPDFYLENLDRELEKLGKIALSPDVVNDIFNIHPDFLVKYDIDKCTTPEERSRQAQEEYCRLDERFVRMTGRRPYADSLLAAMKQNRDNHPEKSVAKPLGCNRIRNPPPSKGKGRKLSL